MKRTSTSQQFVYGRFEESQRCQHDIPRTAPILIIFGEFLRKNDGRRVVLRYYFSPSTKPLETHSTPNEGNIHREIYYCVSFFDVLLTECE